MNDDVVFNSGPYLFEELELEYRGFLAPSFKVLIDGTDVLQQGMGISGVTVRTEVNAVDSCTFTVGNAYDPVSRSFQWVDQYLKIGKQIKVQMGYVDMLKSVFYGIITSITYDYPDSGIPSVKVEARSFATFMQYGVAQEPWEKKTVSDIVKAIAGQYSLTPTVDTAMPPEEPIPILHQRQDDFNFVKDLASKNGSVFFVVGKRLYFKKLDPTIPAIPMLILTWGRNLRRFTPTFDTGSQVQKFTVKGRNNSTQEAVEASSSPGSGPGNYGSEVSSLIQAMSTKTKEAVIITSLETKDEVQKLANALFDKQAFDFLSGDGESIGLPELRAGMHIGLLNVSDMISGPVFLKSVTHTINTGGYLTEFTIGGSKSAVESLVSANQKGNAVTGLKQGTVTGDVVEAKGVMVGVVTDNKDPDKLGRVKVQFPVYNDGRVTDWIPIATLNGGNNRGSVFLPEVNDEVLCAFEMNDMSKPYVIGQLWTKNTPPPEADYEKNNLRKFRSRAGHEFIFDDNDQEPKVTLKTAKAHIIEFTDKDDTIKIADSSGNNSVTIVGGSTNTLTIATSGGSIKIDGQGTMTINANQAVKITGAQINIESSATMEIKSGASLNIQASGPVAIKGAMVQIN